MKRASIVFVAIAASAFLASANAGAQAIHVPPRALLIVGSKKVADQEYSLPRQALESKGVKVLVAGVSLDKATGYGDLAIVPDFTIEQAVVDNYDLVAVIGGEAAINDLRDRPGLVKLVKEAYAKGKLVGAICAGSAVVSRTGIMKDVKATCYPSAGDIEDLKKNGAIYQPDVTVTDKNIITGNGPDASQKFGEALAAALAARK